MPRSLHVRVDRRFVHAETRSRRHLRVDVVAPRGKPRAALSLGLVLDRSGSMAGAKLQLAREGAVRAVHALRPEDHLSLVAYSDEVQLLIRSGPADEPALRIAEQRLRQLEAGGNTDLCSGWLRGCEQVALGLEGTRLGRCLLLTDGLANLGITDREAIVRHAAELRSRGVTTSTLGVGRDFDEVLLREMAEAGGGNFYFAEGAPQLADFIAGETGEATRVVARDAALVLDLPEGAAVTSPNPFRLRTEQTRSVVELGDLVEDQVLSLVLTLEIPPGREGEHVPVQCWLWDPGGVLEGSVDLDLCRAGMAEYGRSPRDRDVDREVAEAYAAAARRRAAELARAGKAAQGREILEKLAAEIRRSAGGDPRFLALAGGLDGEALRLARMDSLDFKRLEFGATGALRSRDEAGMTLGTVDFTSRALALVLQVEAPSDGRTSLHLIAVTADGEATRLVESATQALVSADAHAISCSVVDGGARIFDPGPGAALSRDDELGLVRALAAAGGSVTVAFVRGQLEDGAAAHWHAAKSTAIVSLSAWSATAASPPAEAFVACEMVLHGIRHKCPGWDSSVPAHADARQCWGDTGDAPADLEGKMRSGDLCPSCRKFFGAAGVEVDGLLDLLRAVRDLAQRPAGPPG